MLTVCSAAGEGTRVGAPEALVDVPRRRHRLPPHLAADAGPASPRQRRQSATREPAVPQEAATSFFGGRPSALLAGGLSAGSPAALAGAVRRPLLQLASPVRQGGRDALGFPASSASQPQPASDFASAPGSLAVSARNDATASATGCDAHFDRRYPREPHARDPGFSSRDSVKRLECGGQDGSQGERGVLRRDCRGEFVVRRRGRRDAVLCQPRGAGPVRPRLLYLLSLPLTLRMLAARPSSQSTTTHSSAS